MFLRLAPGASPTSTPVTFTAIPGEYAPGLLVALEDIGFTDPAAARAIIERERLPLELVEGEGERRSVADILADLRDADADALRDALATEQATDRPRVTLVRTLNERLAELAAADSTPDVPEGAPVIPQTIDTSGSADEEG